MAHIRKTAGGWRFEVARHGFRESRTFKTKGEGSAWAAHLESELLAVRRGAFPRKTFADALQRYVEEVSSRKRGARSEALRAQALIRDFPKLAQKQIADITTADLAAWRDARLNSVSKGSVQRDVNLLSHVFTIARNEWRWCGESPFVGFRAPGDNPARTRRIDMREVRKILRWLGYRTDVAPRTKMQETAFAFLISLRTAMRAGEVLALNKERIDPLRRLATVPHKTMHLTGLPREVPLSKHALRLLRPFQDGFRWTVTSASLDALFRKARDSLLIRDLHFHDARADALTRFARKVDALRLAKISGHRDLRVLLQVYYRPEAAEIATLLDR